MDQERELEETANAIEQTVGGMPQMAPARPWETLVAEWTDGDRRVTLVESRRRRHTNQPVAPTLVLQIWARSVAGLWLPVRDGRFGWRPHQLPGLARLVLAGLRAALPILQASVERERQTQADRGAVHMACRAAANAD